MTTVLRRSLPPSSWRDAKYDGLRLRHDAAELARARSFADAAATRFGLEQPARGQFTLAVSEAVSNAIQHGRPCRDGTIHLWVAQRARKLTLGVRNRGEFVFEPAPVDALAERGRGLGLMAELVDRVALTRIGDDVIQVELTKERRSGNG